MVSIPALISSLTVIGYNDALTFFYDSRSSRKLQIRNVWDPLEITTFREIISGGHKLDMS